MERLEHPDRARDWCRAAHRAGRTLGFVPTMGALHEGHLELVRRAAAENDLAVVSVFVNPLQFDDPEDLARYPRDLDGDARLLADAGCALVFTGTLQEFFPEAPDPAAVPREDPGPAAVGLEGEHRPGHFDGVATIVRRLFELVQPDRAYFGAKDYQQTLVVRALAERLGGPRIVVCPTSREPDGLARSSRNLRLGPEARARAATLHRALSRTAERWRDGERRAGALRAALAAELDHDGIEVEYAEVRDPLDFARRPDDAQRLERARALVAAVVGGVRLIDNLRLDAEEGA